MVRSGLGADSDRYSTRARRPVDTAIAGISDTPRPAPTRAWTVANCALRKRICGRKFCRSQNHRTWSTENKDFNRRGIRGVLPADQALYVAKHHGRNRVAMGK